MLATTCKLTQYAAGGAIRLPKQRQRQKSTGPLERAAAAVVRLAVLRAPLVDFGLDDWPLRLQEVQRLARRELRLARPQVRAHPAEQGFSTRAANSYFHNVDNQRIC